MRSEIVSLRADGLTYTRIALRLGVSKGFVAGHLYREREGKAPKPRSVTCEQVRAAVALAGGNHTEAARALGVSRKTIYRHTPRRPEGRYGPNRATDPATREVCDLIARSSMSYAEIADRSGVSESTLSRWRAGSKGKPAFLAWVKEALTREETN